MRQDNWTARKGGSVKDLKSLKRYSKQVRLNLLKKSKGMILGLTEIVEESSIMKYTAYCCSASAEVYVVSRHVWSI